MKHTTISSSYFVSYYRRLMRNKRRKDGHKRGTLSNCTECLALLSLIWETVAEHYLQNEGGVYIDNIGYLCHMLIPNQRFGIDPITKDIRRINTNGYRYNHTVLDFGDPKRFFHLTLSDYLQKKAKIVMNDGERYRFLYNEVQAKRYAIKDFHVKNVFNPEELRYRKKEK